MRFLDSFILCIENGGFYSVAVIGAARLYRAAYVLDCRVMRLVCVIVVMYDRVEYFDDPDTVLEMLQRYVNL